MNKRTIRYKSRHGTNLEMVETQPGSVDINFVDGVRNYGGTYGSIELLDRFKLTIPEDYNHYTQLDTFYRDNIYNHKFGSKIDKNITDSNFRNVSHELMKGKTYTIDIFDRLSYNITAQDCILFLDTFVHNRVFTGAQGLTVLWQLMREKFPTSFYYTVSLDYIGYNFGLWKDNTGHYWIPRMSPGSYEGGWEFTLHDSDIALENHYLLCYKTL